MFYIENVAHEQDGCNRKNCYKGECPKIEYTAMVWLLKENRLL